MHAIGGRILVDAAQLAAHRPIDMRAHDDPGHLDFVALSAHKMYAPFGTGALVGRRDWFRGEPDHAGGGTVRAVTVDDVAWADLPDREEAGSPNVVGAVALAAAMEALRKLGLDSIASHEAELARYARARLANIPGVTLHGPVGSAVPKVGVIPFTVDGFDHGLVAAVLGYEHGVGVRNGCFCAQPYIHHLLGVGRHELGRWLDRARNGERPRRAGHGPHQPGCLQRHSRHRPCRPRALEWLVAGDIQGTYRVGCDGSFVPDGYVEPLLFEGLSGVSD